MGTLFVAGLPEGEPDDITFRVLRTLGNVSLILAEEDGRAQRLLAHHGITTPLLGTADAPKDALRLGDVAILLAGRSPGPSGPSLEWIQSAIAGGFPVVTLPGPVLPIAALVASGLPTDSFVYLGQLPPGPLALRELLVLVADERRTLVAVEAAPRPLAGLAHLRDMLGTRPLVVAAASSRGVEVIWRGTANETAGPCPSLPGCSLYALVIGGAKQEPTRWDEDRLRAEIRPWLGRGLRVKEISRQLAAESGWPRREVYGLVVEMLSSAPTGPGVADAEP